MSFGQMGGPGDQGHDTRPDTIPPFDEWNTYIRSDGGRYCRQCGIDRHRAWRRRKQETAA